MSQLKAFCDVACTCKLAHMGCGRDIPAPSNKMKCTVKYMYMRKLIPVEKSEKSKCLRSKRC